ncbi:MAG TPA: hypothetical protein VM305_00535 [Candidatus Limnocylindrales bacterium]|nr:hypothetical protein [Candidatus Limnocylindrales bacterium]
MAILAGLAGILGRFAGRLLNTTLGWATTLLFGKVSATQQTVLLVVVFASLGWIVLIAGVIVPEIGTMLLAFVPIPDFVEETWIRLAMLAGALILPLAVGAAAVFVTPAERRPSGAASLIKAVLRGYPFTFALALTIVVLAGVATFRRLRALAKRWEDTHLPVIVKPGEYDDVLARIHGVLGQAGMQTTVTPAPKIVSLPPKVLDQAAGKALGALVPDNLMLLSSPELEILVYPSDLAMSGTKQKVAAARAAIVSRLTYAPAYMTGDPAAQAIEDQIQIHALAVPGAGRDADEHTIADLDQKLAALLVSFEDWETTYRQRLQLERDLLRQRSSPGQPDRAADEPSGGGRGHLLQRAAAAGFIGLVIADIFLLLKRRGAEE